MRFRHISTAAMFLSCNDSHISDAIQAMIKSRFKPEVPVLVISQKEFEDILKNAPDWWDDGNIEIYDNLIFMFPCLSYEEFYDAMGNPNEKLRKSIIIKMLFLVIQP